jgi:hypothetical protein
MFRGGLADLDELVLRCRDKKAKEHIVEAVACYKAGAFRQCIVATWIAVVYDFIHKLQELDLSGDRNARAKLEEFEEIHRTGDIRRALDFERHILNMARDEFELITPLEYTDLLRLLEDRNRCAHPSMHSLEEAYQATAELARGHLRNAVTYLLQRPPVQGKTAMDRLVAEVNSEYFPATSDAAVTYFRNGPLARPRESLVRNFVIVLSKELLLGGLDERAERRYVAALEAVRSMHREVFERTLDEKLNGIMQRLEDEKLANGFRFIVTIPYTWQYTGDDVRVRIENFVADMPDEETVPGLLRGLDFVPLRAKAIWRLSRVNAVQLDELIRFEQRDYEDELVDRAVELYEASTSFADANHRGTHLIIPLARYLQPYHVERIMKAVAENDQIASSFDLERVLRAIQNAECVPQEQFDKLLEDHGIVIQAEELPF